MKTTITREQEYNNTLTINNFEREERLDPREMNLRRIADRVTPARALDQGI